MLLFLLFYNIISTAWYLSVFIYMYNIYIHMYYVYICVLVLLFCKFEQSIFLMHVLVKNEVIFLFFLFLVSGMRLYLADDRLAFWTGCYGFLISPILILLRMAECFFLDSCISLISRTVMWKVIVAFLLCLM